MVELNTIQKHQKGDIRVLSEKDINIMVKVGFLNIDTCKIDDIISTGFIIYQVTNLKPLTFTVLEILK